MNGFHRLKGGEGGQASVTYLLAIVVSMMVFVLMANLLMFLYARGVIRAAIDEGARAGAVAGSSDTECLARATDALDDLLAGELGDGVTLRCAVEGNQIVATAEVVLVSPYPGIGDWSFTAVARAVDETSVLP